MNWQSAISLSNYRSYESVRILEYDIYEDSTRSAWLFNVFSNEGCALRHAVMYVSHTRLFIYFIGITVTVI